MNADAVIADPAWLPDRIDCANRLIRLIRTDHETLASSAFLDGRTPIARPDVEPIILPLDDFVERLADRQPALPWLFHMSFCGSTLLARAATISGHGLCLREPQILVDLTNWRAAMPPTDRSLYMATLSAVRTKLAQRWQAREVVAIKPSNWVNSIIADLWRPASGDRAIIVTIDLLDFIIAVLRGGRDRITYTLRLYAQIRMHWPELARIVDSAWPSDPADGLIPAARLVAAMHWTQARLLHAAQHRAGGGSILRFPDFLTSDAAASALAPLLGSPADRVEDSLAQARVRHSKRAASFVGEADANDTIAQLHAGAIAEALAIGERLHAHSETATAMLVTAMATRDGSSKIRPDRARPRA